MVKINSVSDFMAHIDEIPVKILDDIDKRITDWLSSGGTMEDPYIMQQYRFAENYLNRLS